MSPRVSVLLPVYDAEATLNSCLESIRRQALPDFECVVVDDGSRDGSAAVVTQMASRDDRFRLLSLPHRGLVSALNAGLDACTAPLIARMDGDDLMHRSRLAEQVALLDDERLSAAGCHVRLFPRDHLSDGMLEYERWLNSIDDADAVARDSFVECPVAHPTLMLRRTLLAKLRYRDRGWPEDWDIVQRILAAGGRIGMVPARRLFWRDGASRLSRTHPSYSLDAFMACRAHFLAERFVKQSQYILWGYGGTGKALRKALARHDKNPSAIVELHPGRLGQRIHGALVIPPATLVEHRGTPIVVSVAGASARSEIRDALRKMGFAELDDYVCAA